MQRLVYTAWLTDGWSRCLAKSSGASLDIHIACHPRHVDTQANSTPAADPATALQSSVACALAGAAMAVLQLLLAGLDLA